MQTVYVNGKFTAQATTGVQRVARCLLEAVDQRLASEVGGPAARWVLLCPPVGRPPPLRRVETRVVGARHGSLHLWEQWTLPRAARDGLLLNLTGSAPAWAGQQICTLHDAAVFDRPEAYAPLFRGWYRWLFRRLARTAVAINTVSAFSRARLADRLGVPGKRINVIHNGGDHLLHVQASPGYLASVGLVGRRFVLAVGSENVTKNFGAVIEAMAELADDKVLLVIAGGRRGVVFAPAAGKTEASDRVIRLGPVGDAELKALYGAAIALVFASSYEGFGLPPLEAMSCGCPVLASSATAVPEVCGDAALYVDPDSPPDIARRLGQMMADDGLRADLVVRGTARLRQFTWQAAAARLQAQLQAEAGRLGSAA
jgi:glycosyltransferase involved in cell wall biosynthesis